VIQNRDLDETLVRPTQLFRAAAAAAAQKEGTGNSRHNNKAEASGSGGGGSSVVGVGKKMPRAERFEAAADLDPRAPTLREAQPTRRPYAAPVMPHTMLVHRRQRGNPVLNHIRNVKWEFGDVLPDFQMGASTAGLYLSLRYHLLHPDYLDVRIRELQREFRLRVLFVMVDVDDPDEMLVSLTKLTHINQVTMVLTWSVEECARYVETYKAYEKKPADVIQGSLGGDFYTQLTDVLTSIRSVNKSDVLTLASTFGSLQAIMNATLEELQLCSGLGEKKVKRIYEAFHEEIGLGGSAPPRSRRPS